MKSILACVLLISFLPVGAQSKKNIPLVPFDQIASAVADTIRLRGYVLDIYVCPPCPPGATCKPCMPNHFTVIKEKISDREKLMQAKRVRILMEHPQSLKSGLHYEFVIRIRGNQKQGDDPEWISTKSL